MSLNDNEIFYRKLLWHIVVALCLLFAVLLNIMRYQTLQANTPPKKKVEQTSSKYLLSAFFTSLTSSTDLKMIILSEAKDQKYLASVFSFLKNEPQKNITLINCAKEKSVAVKNFLQNNIVASKPCQINPESLKTILSDPNNLVLIFSDQNLFHHTALRVSKHLNLKPHIKITEIKNANQRLSN